MDSLITLVTDERSARIALATCAEPGDPMTHRLMSRVGGVETVRLLADDGPVPGLDGIEAGLWRARLTPRADPHTVARAIEDTGRGGYSTVIPGDTGYPQALHDLGERAPLILWAKGATSLLTTPLSERFTVTGSRAATGYGEHVASELAAGLAREGMVLVSGGAYGIDAAVHRATLAQAGHTIAVLAGGIDRLYPSGNRELLERISDVGLLVAETPPGTPPTRALFIARARIEAAFSGSTTTVEAAARSGALAVAREAQTLGRPVGAVPGPVTSVTSTGAHQLLRDGTARLVTDAVEVRELTNRTSDPSPVRLTAEPLSVERRPPAPRQDRSGGLSL
jgi:DNA processing protein